MNILGKGLQHLSSVALLLLALAIIFFSYELSQLRQQLPQLLTQIDASVRRIEPVLEDFDRVNQLIPEILQQSEGYQLLIPEVLQRVDDINQQLPAVLAAVEQSNQSVLATHQQIDKILPQIPLILAESEALRAEIPDILAESEQLLTKAGNVGREASSGFITGLVGGVISSPINLVSKMSHSEAKKLGLKSAHSFTAEDKQAYAVALEALMKQPSVGAKQSWSNPVTGNKGKIEISDRLKQEGRWCYELSNQLVIAQGEDKGNYHVLTSSCSDD